MLNTAMAQYRSEGSCRPSLPARSAHVIEEALLLNIPLFASLPPQARRELVSCLQEHAYLPGAILIREGEPGERFIILVEGRVEIVKQLEAPDERRFGVRSPGDFVGEMSLLDPEVPRTASVRALEPVRTLELTSSEFDRLINLHVDLALRILREVSARLRDVENDTIRDLREKNRLLTQAYTELREAQLQLIEKEKLEHELQMARTIQESILPPPVAPVGAYQFGACMLPARAVGGDFYDILPLGKGKLGVAIGDVSDKGVPAALFMALFCSLLRAEAVRARNAGQALRRINRVLLERNTTGIFVTALYGVLDTTTGVFAYARAGHELPFLVGPRGEPYSPAMQQGQPLCLFPDPSLDEGQIPLPEGHMLLLYTDGALDAVDQSGQRFGPDRLVETLSRNRQAGAQDLCDRAVADIGAYRGNVEQFDDLTLVAVRRSRDDRG
jgi:sigma-B regulation protein RsbU (phosphoserine phosphatase)